jgi:hypothetical protein
MRPDEFFTAPQRERLVELMDRWRHARDTETALTAAEQAELDQLVAAETESAIKRAKALLRDAAMNP